MNFKTSKKLGEFDYFKNKPYFWYLVSITVINLLIKKKYYMKYLSPEIEALSKQFEITKSLARTNVSCGIFQECDYNEERSKLYIKD